MRVTSFTIIKDPNVKRTEMNQEGTGIARLMEKSRAAGSEKQGQQIIPGLVSLFIIIQLM